MSGSPMVIIFLLFGIAGLFSAVTGVAQERIPEGRIPEERFPEDTIYLRNGILLHGTVLEVDEARIRLLSGARPYEVMKKGILRIAYGNGQTDHIGTGTVYNFHNRFERKIGSLPLRQVIEKRQLYLKKVRRQLPAGIISMVLGSLVSIHGSYSLESRSLVVPAGFGLAAFGMFKLIQGANSRARSGRLFSELERRGVDPLNPDPELIHPLMRYEPSH